MNMFYGVSRFSALVCLSTVKHLLNYKTLKNESR